MKPRKNKETRDEELKLPTEKEVASMQTIVSALGYLKEEAERSNIPDVMMIIEAAYKICFSLHYLQIRGELVDEAEIN